VPERQTPNPVIAEVSDALAWYHTHSELEIVFQRSGAPGDPPQGNKVNKCAQWLRRANSDESVNPFQILGGVLEEFMDREPSIHMTDYILEKRGRINRAMARHGLSYQQGGRILGASTATPTRSLLTILRERDLGALEEEFRRALNTVESDPPAAVTAACAVIESLCKVYIQDNGLQMPSDQSIRPLWRIVQEHLGLRPDSLAGQDIARLLGSLSGIVDAVGALRTHAGSAHGRGRGPISITPTYARLAIHSAHTLAAFVLEVWSERTGSRMVGNT